MRVGTIVSESGSVVREPRSEVILNDSGDYFSGPSDPGNRIPDSGIVRDSIAATRRPP